jgi:hypothetical protein
MKETGVILFLVAVLIAGGYFFYSKQNHTGVQPSSDDTIGQISSDQTTKKSLADRMKICESIPNGTTTQVTETSRVFINLPEDVYSFPNRQIVSHGATIGIVSNGEGLTPNSDFIANKCASHLYEFGGSGSIDLRVKSTDPNAPDYEVHFEVTKV